MLINDINNSRGKKNEIKWPLFGSAFSKTKVNFFVEYYLNIRQFSLKPYKNYLQV